MSSDPAYAVQIAVAAALLADGDLKVLIGLRVYDTPPPPPVPTPYVTIGDDQVIGDGDGCADGSEVHVTVHAWSAGPMGRLDCKRVLGAVRAVLDDELQIDGHVVVDHTFESAHHLRDPDGVGAHSVLTVRYLTEPAA